MRTLLLVIFRPDLYNAEADPRTDDEKLISDIANRFDISEAEVLRYASQRAGVEFTMDEFYITGTLPAMLRHWIRSNVP